MDNVTFETLVEVLAFECANDAGKSKAFADIFYGQYGNRGPSFMNLDSAMGQGRNVTVIHSGILMAAHITNCEMSINGQQASYMGNSPVLRKIRLELMASQS